MLLEQIGTQGRIIESALQGKLVRNHVISNNIANADVPGFRARRVSFEGSLLEALGDYPFDRKINLSGENNPRNRRIDLSGVEPEVAFMFPPGFYRIDGNQVDVESEMVQLYQNSMKFDTLISSVIANSRRLSMVLQRGG